MDFSVGTRRYVTYLKALGFKPLCRLNYAAVLRSGNNELFASSCVGVCRSEQREIVCLCSAAREKHFFVGRSKTRCHRLARKPELAFGIHAHFVQRGGIAVGFGHYLKCFFRSLFRHLSGGAVVKIMLQDIPSQDKITHIIIIHHQS